MYILGLALGHNSTACLLKDGEIVSCVSEERFTRFKNKCGYPKNSINWMLNDNKITSKDIDRVIVVNDQFFSDKFHFTQAFVDSFKKRGKISKLKSYIGYKYPNIFNLYQNLKENSIKKQQIMNSLDLKNKLSERLKIPNEKINIVEHHKAHALASGFNLSRNEKTLIFTLDGEGPEGLCATVNIFDGYHLKTIAKTAKSASLGYLYAIATLYLGMKPLEHEFKVMGLAPYAKKNKADKTYEKIKNIIWVNDNLEFESKFNMPFADNFFRNEMKYERFDNISFAVQKLVEELVKEWVGKAIKKTGISNIALGGGVFMNVKANQALYEMPEVKKMFVMPSCGDESNAIGACFYGYKRYCDEFKLKFSPKPIKSLYLGPKYDNNYISDLISKENLKNRYKIKKTNNINLEIAKLLAKGEIVARCSGKSEWGARALGNRSILSNASDDNTIRILNETIKDRDFWMPFTPSIIDKFEKKYVINPKNMFSPYMVITFNSTDKAKKDIPAAMHPYDRTLRPQIVTKEYNPDYYMIIEEFSKLTGKGGILNTSFNLHGEPNVLSPEDALHTVENSDLKYLAMENYLFEKI